jgi:1-acyl-sn-glycerol-3-phosphate acyltransferase
MLSSRAEKSRILKWPLAVGCLHAGRRVGRAGHGPMAILQNSIFPISNFQLSLDKSACGMYGDLAVRKTEGGNGMSFHIRELPAMAAIAGSVVTTAACMGCGISALKLRRRLRKENEEWLRKEAARSQLFWTIATFRTVRAIARMRLCVDVTADDQRRLWHTPAIVVSNHVHALDIPFIAWFLSMYCGQKDLRWVVKEEIRRWPAIGYSCTAAGSAFVGRDPKRAMHDLKAVRACAKRARNEGASVIVFPEGTRFKKPDPSSPYRRVLPPHPIIISVLLKIFQDCPVCSLTLCQHPGGNEKLLDRTLYAQARVTDVNDVRQDVRAWLTQEWDQKEAFIASLQH